MQRKYDSKRQGNVIVKSSFRNITYRPLDSKNYYIDNIKDIDIMEENNVNNRTSPDQGEEDLLQYL